MADKYFNKEGLRYFYLKLKSLIDGKANTTHTHNISQITNLQTTLNNKLNTNAGITFTESTNNNAIASGETLTTLFSKIKKLFTRFETTNTNVNTLIDSLGHTIWKSRNSRVTYIPLVESYTAVSPQTGKILIKFPASPNRCIFDFQVNLTHISGKSTATYYVSGQWIGESTNSWTTNSTIYSIGSGDYSNLRAELYTYGGYIYMSIGNGSALWGPGVTVTLNNFQASFTGMAYENWDNGFTITIQGFDYEPDVIVENPNPFYLFEIDEEVKTAFKSLGWTDLTDSTHSGGEGIN